MGLLAAGTGLIAATYGLVRFAYGLYLPDMQADLGVSDPAAGAIAAGASVVYGVAALAAFLWAARSRRLFVAGAGATALVGAVGLAVAAHPTWFAVCAIVSSAGAGLASPALVAVLQRNIPRDAETRAQAIVNAGTGPGLIAAGLLALVVLPSWRIGWAIAAAVTGLAALCVLVLDRERPGGADGAGSTDVGAPDGVPPLSWFVAHARVAAAAVLAGIGSAAVWTYGRTALVASGTSEQVSVFAWIAIGFGGASVILTARVMAKIRPPAAWGLATGLVATATGALALAAGTLPAALLACAVFGWGYIAGSGALIAWTSALDAGRAAAGTAMLFILLVLGQAAGAAASGTLLPLLGELGVFLLAAGAAVVAAGLGLVPARSGRARARTSRGEAV